MRSPLSKLTLGLYISLLMLTAACGGAKAREARERERERRHQESKDQLDRDKRNFNSTFDKETKPE